MDNFEKVARKSDIPEGEMMLVEVGGERILLANLEGQICAIGEVCTHAQGYLSDGWIEGEDVVCPLHGSRFNLRTGQVTTPPSDEGEPVYQVRMEGEDILVGSPGD